MTHPIFEAAAFGVVAASLLQIIPAIAAVLAILWYGVLLWESRTVRKMTHRLDDVDRVPQNPDDMTGI